MSAEVLRAAARLMRERAAAAICSCGGPVCSKPDHWYGVEELAQSLYGADASGSSDPAPHIASWHPAVALDVADLLDVVGAWIEEFGGLPPGGEMEIVGRRALTVARTYLGAT